MATEDVILNYRGDASSLVRASTEASESLSDLADQAKKKAKEAATAAEDAIKRAQRAQERATAEGSEAAREAARNAARSATNAIEEAKRAAEEANTALQRSNLELKDAFGNTGDAAAKMSGVLRMAGIEGADVLGDVADAAEILTAGAQAAGASTVAIGVGVLAVAQALAVAYVAWKAYNEESDRAIAIAAMQEEVHKKNNGLLEDTKQTITDTKILNKELTEDQAKLQAAQEAAYSSYLQSTESVRAKLHELRVEQETSWTAGFAQRVEEMPLADYNPFSIAVDVLTNSTSELTAEQDQLNHILWEQQDAVSINVQAHKDKIEAENKSTKSTKGHTTAVRGLSTALVDQKKAYADSIAAMEEEARLNRDIRAGIEALKEAARDASTIEREGSQGVRDARDAELAQLLQMYQETMALMGADADRVAATNAYTEAQIAIRAKYHRLEREAILEQNALEAEKQAERDTRAEEELAKRAEEQAALKAITIDSAMEIADALSVLADTRFQQEVDLYNNMQKCFEKSKEGMTEAERKAAREQLKEQRKAAKTAFRINQAIQIAQAIAGSALAILNAFATVPYPGSLVAAAAATATGVATVATIAAQKPQFHQGGIVQANLLPGEGVANRDLVRAVGERNFEAMNRNPAAAAQTLNGGGTTLIIGRREVGELGRSLMIGRTPVSSAITSRPKAGQLAAGTTTLPVLA